MRFARNLQLAVLLASAAAHARASGIATAGCDGCHSDGATTQVTISASNANPQPGASITLTLSFPAVNGGPGGLYLRSNGAGAFTTVTGQSTKLVNEDELVHSAPKAAVNGTVSFQVQWTAPATKGGVDFEAYVLSSNGNGATAGDGAGFVKRSLAFGCVGTTYFRDQDGDGFGSSQSGTTLDCALPGGYSALDGDCNDFDELTHPGQTEACNGRDDDCDGTTDEGLATSTFYEDQDGDSYGATGGATTMSCAAPPGYSSNSDDCADSDARRYPGANESCNFLDDDCDGRVDDGARAVCGVGMCARYGLTCEPSQCTPGKPEREMCNLLDDDCDGVIDDDQPCPSGEACVEGKCVAGSPDGGTAVEPRPVESDGEASAGCAMVPGFGGASFAVFALLRVATRRRR